jgi:hypothetical protein
MRFFVQNCQQLGTLYPNAAFYWQKNNNGIVFDTMCKNRLNAERYRRPHFLWLTAQNLLICKVLKILYFCSATVAYIHRCILEEQGENKQKIKEPVVATALPLRWRHVYIIENVVLLYVLPIGRVLSVATRPWLRSHCLFFLRILKYTCKSIREFNVFALVQMKVGSLWV